MTGNDPISDQAREEAAGWLILIEDDPDDLGRRRDFKAWLAASPEHRAAWDSVSRTTALLKGNGNAVRRLPKSAWRAAAMAACLALAALPSLRHTLMGDYVTGTGRIETVRLPDGSSVRLGPDSALRVAFQGSERKVELLSGEAQFEVVHDPARPFQVTARQTTITDIGTRFDVAARDSGVSVAVAGGEVRIEPAAGQPGFDLVPGDWMRVAPDGRRERASGLPPELTDGPSSRIPADNRPVAEIVERIRPWYAGRIILADSAIGAGSVTGLVDASDPVRALETIVGPQGGRVLRLTPWLLVVVKS